MFGLCLLVGFDWHALSPDYRWGITLGVLTGIAYAVYMLSMRRAADPPRRAHAGARTVSDQPALRGHACARGRRRGRELRDSRYAILAGAASLLAFVGQVLGWVLIARAMPQLLPSTVGLLLLLQPALSFVLDVLLFARPTHALDWVGLALSLLGIFVASQRKKGNR